MLPKGSFPPAKLQKFTLFPTKLKQNFQELYISRGMKDSERVALR